MKLFKPKKDKILLIDIETRPLVSYTWDIWEQNIAVGQIKDDWGIISWSAKWLGDPESKTMYLDQRNVKDVKDDKKLLKPIWQLMDEADVIIGHNLKKFDNRRLNARFIINGFQKPSSSQLIDTCQLAKAKFGFTSNSLEYLAGTLNTSHKKMKNSGFDLWTRCLNGDKAAWKEMEAYNRKDVLALEELYLKLRPWDSSYNPNLYTDAISYSCVCGSVNIKKNGVKYKSTGMYQRHKCTDCGYETRSKENLFSKEKRKSLKAAT